MPTRRRILIGTACLLVAGSARGQQSTPASVRRVSPGESVTTGSEGEIVIVAGRDAMRVRRNSSIAVLKDGLRLVSGAVLAVFEPGQRKVLHTPTATIGIRGTAVYLEAEAKRTYACCCYGEAVLEPADDPAARETVRTRAHEHPRYIMPRGMPQMLMAAPVLNHTDAELAYLEGLVGRKPPG
jgi:hypothetical protein